MRARPGHLLVEALCALALAGLLAVASATALSSARRLLGSAEARARGARGALEALQVTAAMTRDADSLLLLGDTAIEFSLRVADGVVCARDGSAVVLTPGGPASAAALTAVAQPLEAGDELRAWVEDTVTGLRAWMLAPVESASVRTGEVPCGPAGGLVDAGDGSAERWRLVAAGLDPRVRAGTPVRVGRRGRLAPYRSGSDWMLGWRRCAHAACGVVQPVAGPLRSPAVGGFAVWPVGAAALGVRVAPPPVAGASGPATALEGVVRRLDAGR